MAREADIFHLISFFRDLFSFDDGVPSPTMPIRLFYSKILRTQIQSKSFATEVPGHEARLLKIELACKGLNGLQE
jgi:hypothetical protein